MGALVAPLSDEERARRIAIFEAGAPLGATWIEMAAQAGIKPVTFRKWCEETLREDRPDLFDLRYRVCKRKSDRRKRDPDAVALAADASAESQQEAAEKYARIMAAKIAGKKMIEIAAIEGTTVASLQSFVYAYEAKIEAQREKARAAAQVKPRTCLRCDNAFLSEHFGHRLCNNCRSHAPSMSPLAPGGMGSSGTWRRAVR